MRLMAQVAMVMNLDKCIGCHICSVTCKQTWTNRAGAEYMWFNPYKKVYFNHRTGKVEKYTFCFPRSKQASPPSAQKLAWADCATLG